MSTGSPPTPAPRWRWRVWVGSGVLVLSAAIAGCTGQGSSSIQLTFGAASAIVKSDGPAQLRWSTTGAGTCAASGGWWGSRPTQGDTATPPLTHTTTFTLSCANGEATLSRSVMVQVQGAAGFDAATAFSRVVVDAESVPDAWEKNIGDLNADGLPDLIVAGATGPVTWYEAPNWTRHLIAQAGDSQSGSAAGDIDGDGDIDVVVGTTWHENLGDGSRWTPHSLPDAAAGTHDILIADVDNDGRPDIIMRGETAQTVFLFFQGTQPDTWKEMKLHPSRGFNGLDVADVNGDGWLDIVVGGVWLRNPGKRFVRRNATWLAYRFAPRWNPFAQVKVIDVDGDGHPDIVMSVSESIGNLSWFRAPVNPSTDTWTEHVIDTALDHVHSFVVADIDHDGALDIVASEYEGQGRLLLYLQRPGTWQRSVLGTDSLHNVRAADLHNDGSLDFFGVNGRGVKPVIIYESTGAPEVNRVLVFSRTLGFRHESIAQGIAAIRSLGAAHGFGVDATEDPLAFTPATLSRYRAVVFLSPSGNVLTGGQREALRGFIEGGGGFVGVHNASANVMEDWAWYGKLVGARAVSEIPTQRMTLTIADRAHLSTRDLPDPWTLVSEAYNYDVNPQENAARVLITLDETTVTGGSMGKDHPYSWYRAYDGGRMWYTVGGANAEDYANPLFLKHLLGGIRYAGGF